MRESMELAQNGDSTDKDTLFLLGGAALVLFGAGLILSNRHVRGFVGQLRPGDLVQAAMPDFERYLKLRAM